MRDVEGAADDTLTGDRSIFTTLRDFADSSCAQERARLNLNGSRQISKSATELRGSDTADSSPPGRVDGAADEPGSAVHHHRHRRHNTTSVAQRTHTFFATLKSRWARSRSKERKKSRDAGSGQSQDAGQPKNPGVESDYAADYSSEHSRSSSATQSPARHGLGHPGERTTRLRFCTRERRSTFADYAFGE